MMITSFAVVVVAVTLIVLTAVVIPAILEIRRTATAVRETVLRLDSELQPAIKELRQTLSEVRTLTETASAKVEELDSFMSAVGDTGRGLRAIGSIVSGVTDTLTKSSLWLTGARVAGKFVMEKFVKKGGN